jgi:hypothetical protein
MAGAALAPAADVKDVACDPSLALGAKPIAVTGALFAKAAQGSGTVHPDAIVASVRTDGFAFDVAIDTRKSDDTKPGVIRFDFSGRGKFSEAWSVELKLEDKAREDKALTGTFGPATLNLDLSGKVIPITVKGDYYKLDTTRRLNIYLCRAVEGTVALGAKSYPVRLVDGDNNLTVNSPVAVEITDDKIAGYTSGDTVVVDVGDGSFAKPETLRRAFFGQPVQVDGKWYTIAQDKDSGKLSAADAGDIPTGKVRVGHGTWSGVWVSEKHVLFLSGGKDAIEIPAGKYAVFDYVERVADAKGEATLTRSGFETVGGKVVLIDVPAGKTTDLAIGSPLVPTYIIDRADRDVTCTFVLKDASGAMVSNITLPGNAKPDPATLVVLDTDDKEVYRGKLEYG